MRKRTPLVDAFMLAEGWKRKMTDKGWQQVRPAATMSD